ncbi:head-tail connector protein [Aliihoeflea sp. 2WW]|uniref:head-tail connector protein n=1 Tax=Aliihoeflea sp. 2WW TaxID=1381123 RepID=UPI000467BFBD|nr:head-tail connector protein [Aliihoeflea sp. 2WW]
MTIVTVATAKAHLNITDDADDTLIAGKIAAAEAYVDRWLDVKLADMNAVPADLREAILQLVGHLYENREAMLIGISAEELPLGFREIIDQHRAWGF